MLELLICVVQPKMYPSMTNFDYILIVLISILVIITLIAILILVERKFLALSQRRIGPSILGRRGFLQIAADVIKPLFKDIFEQKFQSVTLIAFMIFMLLFTQLLYLAFFSYGISGLLYDSIDVIIILQLFVCGMTTLSVLLIGYLSGTKYGIVGSVRLVLVELSIAVPTQLVNVMLLLNTGGLDYESVAYNQGYVPNCTLLALVYSIVYIINMFIFAQRAPLDMIENEGELVAGYNTEFSGPDVLVIYFAEYLHIFSGVVQLVLLLLGASLIPMSELLNLESQSLYSTVGELFSVGSSGGRTG